MFVRKKKLVCKLGHPKTNLPATLGSDSQTLISQSQYIHLAPLILK